MDNNVVSLIDIITKESLEFIKDAFQFILPDSIIIRVFIGMFIILAVSVFGYKRFLE